MIELTGSTDFLLVLSNMYTSIVFNHTLNQEDLVKFKGFIEDSQEYANGNQSKSVQILIKYLEHFREKNAEGLSQDDMLAATGAMLQQINDNLYPINIVYYTNKLKTYMMKEGRLEALKTCKDSITEDVNSFEQVQCRANLLKAYLTSSSIDNADEITTLKNELEAAVTKRNTEGFNYNIF